MRYTLPPVMFSAAILLGGCFTSYEVSPAETDDASVAQPEEMPKAWAPYTLEEARELRNSFSWQDTQALPEEPLDQRTPPELRKATNKNLANPINQIISSLVSLYYVQIYIKDPDHLRELDEMGVHWDLAPLFESELPKETYTHMSFEGDPQDGGGMFVYTLMPAVIYNAIRAAALLGEETYPAMILRQAPIEARAWDGSVKWEYLAGALLSYAPAHTHLTDDGETLFPSVLDDETNADPAQANADPAQAQQKRFGRRLRKWARKARDTVRKVVDTVRESVGKLAKAIRPETELVVLLQVKSHDIAFPRLIRAWDRYGSASTSGKELKLQNTRVNVSQWGGITLFPTKTSANGVATVSVPRDRATRVCVEADSPAARMEAGLLWPVRVCVKAGTTKGTTQGLAVVLLGDEFAALAQLQDAREFATSTKRSEGGSVVNSGLPERRSGRPSHDSLAWRSVLPRWIRRDPMRPWSRS